jgi:hypothetical protein
MKMMSMPALAKHAPGFSADESWVMKWEGSKKAQ